MGIDPNQHAALPDHTIREEAAIRRLHDSGLGWLEDEARKLAARNVERRDGDRRAARDNAGKVEYDYIFDFPTAVEAFCRVKEIGAAKYERDNWKAGGKPDREYISAMGRHIAEFKKGETFAGDTGCLHLAHAMWNIMALIELNYPGVTHDPELFAKMKAHWEAKKTEKSRENETARRVDSMVLGQVHAKLMKQRREKMKREEAEAATEDERDAIAAVIREGR